jgi:hypothetical protein
MRNPKKGQSKNGVLTGAVNSLGWLIFLADLFLSTGFIPSIFTGGGRHI